MSIALTAIAVIAFGRPDHVRAADDADRPAARAARALAIAETVLANHPEPPARQQMLLEGVRAACRRAGVAVPADLARRISDLTRPDELAELLETIVPPRNGGWTPEIQSALDTGMLSIVPGGASLIAAKERKVAEQLEANRYVGIQIALAYDEKEQRPRIAEVFRGGPADRAGAKVGDWIVMVDGVDTKGVGIRRAIELLRGELGTNVTITVQQPSEQATRTLRLTREMLPRATIVNLAGQDLPEASIRVQAGEAIGYVRFKEIGPSTPHELRAAAASAESDEIGAIILDLRGLATAQFHPTILLADCLLDGGTIGCVAWVGRTTTYRAEPDALFKDLRLAALVDGGTAGAAEWLAAALQDNHRAIIVGAPTHADAAVRETIAVGDGSWSIRMVTGVFQRADGRPIGPFPAPLRADEAHVVRVIDQRRPGVPAADAPPLKFGVVPDESVPGMARAHVPIGATPERAPQPRRGGPDMGLQNAVEELRNRLAGAR